MDGPTRVTHGTHLAVLALAFILNACSARADAITPSVATEIEATPVSANTATAIPPATSTSLPPALPVLTAPVLGQVEFQNEHNGWGIAINGSGHVVRTVDGGSSWLNASPAGLTSVGSSASLVILDTNTVWLLAPASDFFSGRLYRSTDGGITWNSNPVPFGTAWLQFVDTQNGRALADRGARAGEQAVELFQSADGGVTWTSVFHNDPSQPGSSDSLPLEGIKNGMTFSDANNGWVTSSVPADGQVYLYRTQDGGVTWLQQSVALPAGYEAYQYLAQAPVFFGKVGFLPLMIRMPEMTALTIFSTQDGGLTWSGDPSSASQMIQPGLVAAADPQNIRSWDGGAELYFSADGARTWSSVRPALDMSGSLAQLQFVPNSNGGFTGWALSRVDEAGNSQLYRTTDGINWRPLIQ